MYDAYIYAACSVLVETRSCCGWKAKMLDKTKLRQRPVWIWKKNKISRLPLIGPLERLEWGGGVGAGATGLSGEEGVVGLRRKESDVVLERPKRWREKQQQEEEG